MEQQHDDVALTEAEAARALGVSSAVLRSWRADGRGPTFRRFGRAVRYLRRDLDAFIDASAVSPDRPSTSGATTTPVPTAATRLPRHGVGAPRRRRRTS